MDAYNGEPFDEWWAALPGLLKTRLMADPARALTDSEYLEVSRYDLHVVHRSEFPDGLAPAAWRLRAPVQAFVRTRGYAAQSRV
jgi:hypothetical protein